MQSCDQKFGMFGENRFHQTYQEKDLALYGIPVVDGFGGSQKSYTIQPSDPKAMSSIGVL